ncbi:MAG: hypothetical protein HXY49_06505 [Ignavibacteriaceae bacterium]|nr:hypothetical protein [Ignavibacteriaceae bacterium]
MKSKLLIIVLISAAALLIGGCDKPAPTELIDDQSVQELVEVEVLSKEIEDEYYSNGFDTTGITQDIRNFTGLISLTGTRLTIKNFDIETSTAFGIFLDRTKPIRNSENEIIGFQSFIPGQLQINNHIARIAPFIIRFRDQGINRDTTLGNHYILFRGKGFGDPFVFNYNSSIEVQFNPQPGNQKQFTIQTPTQVIGNINLSKKENKLNAVLQWNAANSREFEIILGAKKKGKRNVFPLFRIRTRDDGLLRIPPNLLNSISTQNFDAIVFSLIRRVSKNEPEGIQNLTVISQSIHTIIFDLY